jgi:thiol-disulfide isomerase/thioredoxin
LFSPDSAWQTKAAKALNKTDRLIALPKEQPALVQANQPIAPRGPGSDNPPVVPKNLEVPMIRVLIAVVGLAFGFASLCHVGKAQEKEAPKIQGPPAHSLLTDGLAKAKKDNKAVFLAFGSPTCGWCKYLDKYHARPAVEKTLGKYLVFVKVDVVENPGGDDLYKKYAPTPGGVPVWVILSADGKVLGDSFEDGKNNVGFPYAPNELIHYERVLRAALPGLTADEMAGLIKELKDSGPQKK